MQKNSSNYLCTINSILLCIYKIDDSTQIVREHKNLCQINLIIKLPFYITKDNNVYNQLKWINVFSYTGKMDENLFFLFFKN